MYDEDRSRTWRGGSGGGGGHRAMHITSLFLAYVSLAVAILISTVMVALIKDNKDRLRDTQGSGKVRTVHVRIGSRVKFEDNDSANMSLKGRCGRLISTSSFDPALVLVEVSFRSERVRQRGCYFKKERNEYRETLDVLLL